MSVLGGRVCKFGFERSGWEVDIKRSVLGGRFWEVGFEKTVLGGRFLGGRFREVGFGWSVSVDRF